jgi:hypothetical protein
MLIFISLGLSGWALMLAEVIPIIRTVKKLLNKKRLKPFDCPFCMAFWLSVAYSIFFGTSFYDFIFIVGFTPILTLFLERWLKS